MHTRYIFNQVDKDLQRKMVFVGGPRQVGKTTLAKSFLQGSQVGYLNWDIAEDREKILEYQLPNASLWVFDEIHKYRGWRNYLKGVFDKNASTHKILVTGSAKLDYYRYSGDSLQGRYHYIRLYPLSVAELKIDNIDGMYELFTLGGFPESFFGKDEIEAKRWSIEYRRRLIEEDLVKLEQVKDLGKLELLMLRLPGLVGSPLSINSLREDLQLSHATVANWVDIFVRLYAIFKISPFGYNLLRAVKKEQKHYHFDWSIVKDKVARFENMVALHLLKWVHFLQDTQAREIELQYFRDTDGREVDFIIVEDLVPIHAIECKYTDSDVSKSLEYFKNKFPSCKTWQLSMNGQKDYVSKNGTRVCNALSFLRDLV